MQSLENDPIIPIWYRQQAFCHFHFIFIEPKLESDSKKNLLKYRNDLNDYRVFLDMYVQVFSLQGARALQAGHTMYDFHNSTDTLKF